MSSSTNRVLKFTKVTDKAFSLVKRSKLAAGYDLRSAYDYVIPAQGKELVMTDVQIAVPEGTYGRVVPPSDLPRNHCIHMSPAGVIDADYRGNLGIMLYNQSSKDFQITIGDRIAQLICKKIEYPELEELPRLDNTERGARGFGSSDVQEKC